MGDEPSFIFGPRIPGVSPIAAFGPIVTIPTIPDIPPVEAPAPVPARRQRGPAAAFFLPAVDDSDPRLVRGDVRDALKVAPIIDGRAIFIALENAIEQAEKSVLIAFWALNPLMKLVTDSDMAWMDLLTEKARSGVRVRVLLNDFDPGLQPAAHVSAWSAYWHLFKAAASLSTDSFQVVCSRHEAETSAATMAMVRPGLYDGIAAELNKIADSGTRKDVFGASPGLWDKLDLLPGDTIAPKVKNASYPASPGVHHQKLVIVDGKYAFTGGLNVSTHYLDSREHDKPELPWHDAFVKVEGSQVVEDFIRNYIGFWNQERVRGEAFLTHAYSSLNIKITPKIRPTTDLTLAAVPVQLTSTVPPKIPSQVHRTVSRKGTDPIGVPVTLRQDVLEGYVQAISKAENFIYLENQYFREQVIADAIIQRHKAKPRLQTIILLPRVIEEFLNSQGDELSLHGAALQFELLKKMKTEIGRKLGLFCLVRKDDKLIYVHSKLFLVDDKFASIGSANCNPRSFRVDTELDFVWYDPVTAKALRLDLWKEILGNPPGLKTWRPARFLAKWSAIAGRNTRVAARSRKGFVAPFDNANDGKKSLFPISPFV